MRREIKSSQDQILKTLLGLGLTRLDSQVYIYLAKKGPQGGQNLSKGLKVQKQQLYRSLKNLQKKGIVNANLEHPAQFYAVAFDKVVDIFVKSKMAEAQSIQENKNEILANWQAITLGQSSDPTAKFNIIEGRGSVYAKVLQMMKEAKDQLSTITTVIGLLRADQFGLFDDGLARQIKPRLQFRAITELSMQNLSITKNLFKDLSNRQIAFEGRIPDLSLTLPQLIIKDKDEILFFITPNGKEPSNPEQDDMCIWTNCQSLVQAFTGVFEDFWQNSTDIKVKITELETGKPAVPKTFIIKDSESAVKQYNTILNSAEEEIILVTSSAALTQLCKAKFLDDCHEKGVLVRIMAPITSQNLTAAQEISRYYEVRHVPAEYIGTTIVDGEHLFQFKNSPTKQGEQEAESYFDNTFYTNDSEYVEKTRTMLNDLWKNAQRPSIYTLKSETIMHKPSCVTLDSLIEFFPQAIYTNSTSNLQFGSKIIKEEPTKPITEKDILKKIIVPERIICTNPAKHISRMYASMAKALVYPPKSFNLPKLMIQPFHVDKQSSFGAEDYIVILLQLEKETNSQYTPVAFIGDNPNAQEIIKRVYSGTPLGNNVILANHDEIQIQVHGNTMFAGWTVPIPLPPTSYVLPPACLLIEAYGDVKTAVGTVIMRSGFKVKIEANYLSSYVTFIHPSSKYSGPGTDAILYREYISTNFPPQSISD